MTPADVAACLERAAVYEAADRSMGWASPPLVADVRALAREVERLREGRQAAEASLVNYVALSAQQMAEILRLRARLAGSVHDPAPPLVVKTCECGAEIGPLGHLTLCTCPVVALQEDDGEP